MRKIWKLADIENDNDSEDLHFFRHLMKREYKEIWWLLFK